jgi:outer membrane protein assembly factor BamB
MPQMQVRRRDLHLPSARIAVLLAQMKRSIISHPANIIAVLFCLNAQLLCHAQSEPTSLWVFRMFDGAADSTPAVAADGTVYQADFAGKMRAVSPQGRLKWTFKINTEIKSSPAIADDGTFYFGARDRKLYAVTPQGDLKWSFMAGAWIDSSPAIAEDGTIYFGSWDANFYALNPDGSKKWIFATSNIVVSSPAIGKDGTIYFGSHDKKLYALKPDGKLLWSFNTGGQIISSPAVGMDGTVFFTSLDGNLYALGPEGSERWRLHTGGTTESSPVLDENENLYLAVNTCVWSVDRNGKKRWDWCASAYPIKAAAAAVAANGLVYFSVTWRNLFAFRSDGAELWHLEMLDSLVASPVIDGSGTIYICDSASLRAINSTNGLAPPAKSSWPMFRANARHTGRAQNVN